jgi:hypothetical protein
MPEAGLPRPGEVRWGKMGKLPGWPVVVWTEADAAAMVTPPPWLAHADMTTLPKVDTSCTALSLITSLNGNTVRNFPTRGQLSAAQGSPTTVSA